MNPKQYQQKQAFRRRDMSALNVYRNNGELMSHFENLPADLLAAVEREPEASFWIQTSSDKFYPDFLAKLTNGKRLAVEYKGAHLARTPDTEEKERLGKLWEERSQGGGSASLRW